MFNMSRSIKYAAFVVFPVIIYVGYALSWMGATWISRYGLHAMMVAFHTLLCLFLMYQFHPWSTVQLRQHDSSIIFAAAVLLLTNVVFLEISSYLPVIPDSITKIQNHIVSNPNT